jgi:hypothetical protein
MASPNIGKEIKIKAIKFELLFKLKRIETRYAPRKVLPVSPINILAGSQFQYKKPSNEPNNIKIKISNCKAQNNNISIIFPAKIPSMPSMKLQKFMIETPNKEKQIK